MAIRGGFREKFMQASAERAVTTATCASFYRFPFAFSAIFLPLQKAYWEILNTRLNARTTHLRATNARKY